MLPTALHEDSGRGRVAGRVDDDECTGQGVPVLLQTLLQRKGAYPHTNDLFLMICAINVAYPEYGQSSRIC